MTAAGTTPTDIRLRLFEHGYRPLPLIGKNPQVNGKGWQTKRLDTNPDEIRLCEKTWPDAKNTGILTRDTPVLDLDIRNPEAAEAAEQLVSERYDEHPILVRFGNAPKRAIPFQTTTPFQKITTILINAREPDPIKREERIEFLGDGQQVVVHGIHPDTHKPYTWHGGELWDVHHNDLPGITAEQAQHLVDDIAELLVTEFDYQRKEGNRGNGKAHTNTWTHVWRSSKTSPEFPCTPTGEEQTDKDGRIYARVLQPDGPRTFVPKNELFPVQGGGDGSWPGIDDLINHDNLCSFAMKLLRAGTNDGAVVNMLRGMVSALPNVDEERRQRRLKEIPDMVRSARAKLDAEEPRAGGDEDAGARTTYEPNFTMRDDGDEAVRDRFALWPDPDLAVLRLQRREAPKLPLEIFGESWARWIEDTAKAAACPVDYVAASLLAAASAAIGHARWAQAVQGWAEPPHLWCASVGDSGDGKSPGADVIFRHIMPEMERRLAVDFPDRLREAQAAIAIAEARQEKWESEVKEAVKKGETPPSQPPPPIPEEPIKPRLVLSDVTIEKVAGLLARAAPKGVLMHRDELTGWLMGMTAYNDGARAFWLEAYGGRPYRVDRVKHPVPIIVPRLAVSWNGGIQPARLAEVMRDADDGLLARFMWLWPEPVSFRISDKPPAVDWAIACFDRLRMLDLAAGANDPEPVMVPLTAGAVRRLELFGKLMQKEKEATAGLMRSAMGKARGLALRLSLLLEHLYWCAKEGYSAPPSVITEETLLAAAKFVMEYAMPMAERTYGDAACTELDRNTATLARWIKRERPSEIHVRNMQRVVRLPGLTTAKAIHDACKALIEAGWLGQPAGGAGFQQRGTKSYPVSPRLPERLSQ